MQNIVEEEKKGGYTAVTETLKTAKKRGGGTFNSPSPGAEGLSEDDVLSSGNSMYVTKSIFYMVFIAIVALF